LVDLLPEEDKKHQKEMDNDSVMPTDWLGCTGEFYPAVDLSYGKGTWKHLFMCVLKTHFRQFCIGVDGHFKSVHGEHSLAHMLKTQQNIKSLESVNER
jgi:hypothetical protein